MRKIAISLPSPMLTRLSSILPKDTLIISVGLLIGQDRERMAGGTTIYRFWSRRWKHGPNYLGSHVRYSVNTAKVGLFLWSIGLTFSAR